MEKIKIIIDSIDDPKLGKIGGKTPKMDAVGLPAKRQGRTRKQLGNGYYVILPVNQEVDVTLEIKGVKRDTREPKQSTES